MGGATPPNDNGFWSRGYRVVDDLLPASALTFVKAGMDASERGGRMTPSNNRKSARGALNEYAPLAGEALLQQCRPAIEALVDRDLEPAYAFWRIYARGAELRPHVDRNACEVSATLPIFSDPADGAWPIHVRDLDGADQGISLRAGQALVYQGCRIQHWREPFRGERQYQLLLHYVIRGGDMSQHALDGRGRLGFGANERSAPVEP